MRRIVAGLATVLVACAPSGDGGGASSELGGSVETREALPSHAPDRFGFGSEASAERVAMWDIDVPPDGAGLPAGSGTVAEGQRLYETLCVECHGPTGTEGPNDRLVGGEAWGETAAPALRTVGNYWQYSTTLFDYIRRAMPHMTPGLLTADQTYSAVAYLLHLNEIIAEHAVMDAETLPAVEMPARDRFVLDDRRGGPGPLR